MTRDAFIEVSGLKTSLADNLIDAWAKNRLMRNLLIYLQGLGISAKISQRIFNEYGAQTQQIIEHNPYQLAEDVFLDWISQSRSNRQESGCGSRCQVSPEGGLASRPERAGA